MVSHFALVAVYTTVVQIQYYHDKMVYTSCNVTYRIMREWIVDNGQHHLMLNILSYNSGTCYLFKYE